MTSKIQNSLRILKDTLPLAGKFSFRLGATSYVVPADLATNVQALAGIVDDIEVVLFESEETSNLPDEAVLDVMRTVQEEHCTSYTIHFPLDIDLGSNDADVRERSVSQCKRIISLMEPVSPFGYVLHLPLCEHPTNGVALARWRKNAVASVRELIDHGLEPKRICVETLSYPYEYVWPVVEELNLSVCLDIGHVWLNHYDLESYFELYEPRARIIHLHGLDSCKDHCSLAHIDGSLLQEVVGRLANRVAQDRVVTMEVFGLGDFVSSLKTMEGQQQ